MRLFVAICPPQETLTHLRQVQAALGQYGTGNFTASTNLHMTLAFLGETDRVSAAVDAIKAVDCPQFMLRLEKLGTFDDLYWAGARLTPELQALHKCVTAAFQAEGFQLERRKFRPHFTLCRQFCPQKPLSLETLANTFGESSFSVEAIHLMRSQRIQGKLIYTSIFRQPLKG